MNGVDKYVTESMPTEKEEDIVSVKGSAEPRPRQKPTVFIDFRFRHWNTTITRSQVLWSVKKPWPDCYDMINQSHEEATERSTTVTSSKSSGGRSSQVLPNCYLKIGYQLWQKEEEEGGGGAKKRLQYCVNPNSSNQFFCFRAMQGLSGDNAVDPALQDNVLLLKGFTEYLFHDGNASEVNSIIRNGSIQAREKPQERKTSSILHHSEPDGGRTWHGWISMLSCETKDRAIQEYLETTLKYSILVQFGACSRERPSFLPDTVQCGRPLWHTACSLHWESGMFENSGWALPEGSLNSECHEWC